jgi:hypothetical protein
MTFTVQSEHKGSMKRVLAYAKNTGPYISIWWTKFRKGDKSLFFCGWDGGLNLGLHACKLALFCLCHTFSPLCSCYFWNGVTQSISPRWPLNAILPVAASKVGRLQAKDTTTWPLTKWFLIKACAIVLELDITVVTKEWMTYFLPK